MAAHRLALFVGVGALLVLFGAGVTLSLGDGRLPPLELDYGTWVWAAVKDGRADEAIGQLELAAAIDFESRGRVLPALAWVARHAGEREVERDALLRFARLSPANADTFARLAELALSGSAGERPDAEVIAQAERYVGQALERTPDSIAALVVSGRIALLRGEKIRAFEIWNRAGKLDPGAADEALRPVMQKDPELGHDFLAYLNQERS